MLSKIKNLTARFLLIAFSMAAALSLDSITKAQMAIDPFLAGDQLASEANGDIRLASAYSETAYVTDQGVAAESQPNIGLASYATGYDVPPSAWRWELLPDGLIYRSYQAGPRESRISLHAMSNRNTVTGTESVWDATVGGRTGVLRLGNGDPSDPRGWQLDIEGGAIVRLNLDEERDLDASDFRFGVPLTYTEDGKVHYKFGYYHLSSHLGDEFIARAGTNDRINYVRDAIIFGTSYNANECLRVYGEIAYAFFTAGGAEPWEIQFGAEYSKPGPTGFQGTPFVATNAHLREEVDFSGDWTFQTGWLWRGVTGSTFRMGLHYMNGKSTQYQFFNKNEEQVGFGIWYDF